MLLIKILLTIAYAILSLPVFHLFFPQIMRIDLQIKDDDNRASNMLVLVEIGLIIGFSILISIFAWNYDHQRQVWYAYILPACYPIFWQFIYACYLIKKHLLPIVLPVLVLLCIGSVLLPIRDQFIAPYDVGTLESNFTVITQENMAEEEEEELKKQPLLKKEDIKARFGATTISEAQYSNGQYIYTLEDDTGNFGVAIDNSISVKFYPCKHKNEIEGAVREKYKTEEIVELGIAFNNETPYAKYGILKRTTLFGKPVIDLYLLLNMVEEDVEITSYEELPEFARD